MKNKFTILIFLLFTAYLAALIKLLVFKYPPAMTFEIANGNYIPFKTILNYLGVLPESNIAIRNLGGNLALFIPLGFFAPLLRRSSGWKSVLIIALVISAALEITQGIFQVGVFDLDDILLNVLGALLGYVIFVCVKFLTKKCLTS